MRAYGNRQIEVNKKDLIEKIRKNKKNHVETYEKAVIAYKVEALKQLEVLKSEVENGSLEIKLNLVSPVNNAENYDKIIEMFDWEVKDVVTLEQKEFLEYVQDETEFAVRAKFLNESYLR
jgi:hypothetical protein